MFWADEDVEFLEATYEPGGASSPDDSFVRHNGHEFGYVLSGTLRVVVGFDEFILEPGDSITFPSSTPHRLSNDGTETVRAIWVVRGRRGAEPAQRDVRDVPEPASPRVNDDEPRTADASSRSASGRDREPATRALVVGVTGISGGNLARRLLADGWEVAGLCRRPRRISTSGSRRSSRISRTPTRSRPRCAARRRRTSSSRPGRAAPTEAENCDVNGRMLQNLLDATGAERSVRHVALVTGLKHYLGPVRGVREGAARHAVLRGAGAAAVRELLLRPGGHPLRRRRARRVHVDGAPAAHADRLGARQRDEHGRDARRLRARSAARRAAASTTPGSQEQWEAVTDVTDAGLLADHLVWAATTPAAANQALNIVNGDVFRWRRLWPRLAAALDVEPVAVRRGAGAARAADGRRRRGLARDRPPSRPARPGRRARSPRGGTRTPTSGARSRRSPTWAAAGGSASSASATPSRRSPTSSRACAPSGSCRERGCVRALRFHAARDLRIEEVPEPPRAGRRARSSSGSRPAASAAPTCTSTSRARS